MSYKVAAAAVGNRSLEDLNQNSVESRAGAMVPFVKKQAQPIQRCLDSQGVNYSGLPLSGSQVDCKNALCLLRLSHSQLDETRMPPLNKLD